MKCNPDTQLQTQTGWCGVCVAKNYGYQTEPLAETQGDFCFCGVRYRIRFFCLYGQQNFQRVDLTFTYLDVMLIL